MMAVKVSERDYYLRQAKVFGRLARKYHGYFERGLPGFRNWQDWARAGFPDAMPSGQAVALQFLRREASRTALNHLLAALGEIDAHND